MAGRGDQIKEYLIALEVYGKPESFDPKIDSTVRSEASKLRTPLTAYYETKGQNDPLILSIPRGTYVPHFETRNVVEIPSRPVLVEPPIRTRRLWWPSAKMAAALAVVGFAVWYGTRPATPKILTPIRLTSGDGLASAPAISRDGKLLVYASTRAGRKDRDLWLQQIPSAGEPLRITSDGADELDPDIRRTAACSPSGRSGKAAASTWFRPWAARRACG